MEHNNLQCKSFNLITYLELRSCYKQILFSTFFIICYLFMNRFSFVTFSSYYGLTFLAHVIIFAPLVSCILILNSFLVPYIVPHHSLLIQRVVFWFLLVIIRSTALQSLVTLLFYFHQSRMTCTTKPITASSLLTNIDYPLSSQLHFLLAYIPHPYQFSLSVLHCILLFAYIMYTPLAMHTLYPFALYHLTHFHHMKTLYILPATLLL